MWFTALCLPLPSEEERTSPPMSWRVHEEARILQPRLGGQRREGKPSPNSKPSFLPGVTSVIAITCLGGPFGSPSLFRLLPQCPLVGSGPDRQSC